MKFLGLIAVLAVFLLSAAVAPAGECVRTSAVVVQQQQYVPVQAQVQVQQVPVATYSPALAQSAPACYTSSAAVLSAPVASYYPAPVVQQAVIQRSAYYQPVVQQQVVVQRQAVGYGYGGGAFLPQQQVIVGRGFQQGGFGGGFGLRGQFQQGVQQAGILGGLERLTGLGNGSGDFARGAIIGGLGVRSNLFGLRGR